MSVEHETRAAALQLYWAQGLGNRFWVIDLREPGSVWPEDPRKLAIEWCDLSQGLLGPESARADGLVLVGPGHDGSVASMQIYNADGTRAQMCGNALRCLGWLVAPDRAQVTVDSDVGRHLVRLLDGSRVQVSMGKPSWMRPSEEQAKRVTIRVVDRLLHGWAVSMGNPHFVLELDSVQDHEIEELGPALSTHTSFPEGANIEFCFSKPQGIRVRVWERGVGETLACGTGACAVAWAHTLAGGDADRVTIDMPGGQLTVARMGQELSLAGDAELQRVLISEGSSLVFEASQPSPS